MRRERSILFSLAGNSTERKNRVHAWQLKYLAECFDDYEILKQDEGKVEEFKLLGSCSVPRDQCEVVGQP